MATRLDVRQHRRSHVMDQDERFWGQASAAVVLTLWMSAMLAIAYDAHKNNAGTSLPFDMAAAAEMAD